MESENKSKQIPPSVNTSITETATCRHIFGIRPHLKIILILSAILLLTVAVYSNSINNGFVNWDDGENVYDNVDIRELSYEKIKLYFSKPLLSMYTPLIYISYAIDYGIGGLNPFIYHTTNLFLHLLNITLLFIVVRMLTQKTKIAAIVAILFAVHPLNTGAVAPVSTRGILLYSFFFLAAFLSYICYLKDNLRLKYFVLTFFLFLMALLSKSAAVVLPLVLLLTDYFYTRKFDLRAIAEKIPFFILSLIFGILTFVFREDTGNIGSQYVFSVFDRIFIVAYSLAFYVLKVFIPVKLSAFYPYPLKIDGFLPFWFYLTPLAIGAFIFLINRLQKYRREFIFGSLFFLVNIILVLKIVPIGGELVCDRYAYLPYIGLFLIIGWAYCGIVDRFSSSYSWINYFLIILVVLYSLTFSVISYERIKVWKDSITLYNDILEKYPFVDVAYNNRGLAKIEGLKDYAGAIEDYNKAIKVNPGNALAYNNRGLAKIEGLKNYDGAIEDYNKAIKVNPGNALAYINRGNAKIGWGKDYAGAIEDYNKAIKVNPGNALAYNNRGLAKIEGLKDYSGAIEDYNKAIKVNPGDPSAYNNRGLAKIEGFKDYAGAIEDYNKAIKLNPAYALAYNNRGLAKIEGLKDYTGAVEDYNKAIKVNPAYALAYNNRGLAKIEGLKDYAGAIEDYNKAIKVNPGDALAYNNRGNVKKDWGKDYKGALEDYNKAIKLNPAYMPSFFNRAVLKMEQNDYEGALADYKKILEIDPYNFMAYFRRGNIKMAQKDYKGASSDYGSAIALNSDYAEAYWNRGNLRMIQERYGEALTDYNQVLRLNPKDAGVYFNRAWSRWFTSDKNGACADWRRSSELGAKEALSIMKTNCR